MAGPIVFISSTSEDLTEYRAAARDAAVAEKFHVEMQEYFPICDARSLAKCMELVDSADLVVVIVAERYGWIPADQAAGESKSITWLECLRAAEAVPRKEVLAFLVAKDAKWPVELKDSYRASVAMEKGEGDDVLAAIRRDVDGLKEFKKWLNAEKVRGEFRDPSELKERVRAALRDWRDRHQGVGSVARHPMIVEAPAPSDPRPYLDFLFRDTAHIEIRGLAVSAGKAHLVPIEELYVTLRDERGQQQPHAGENRERQPLDHALAHSRLVILGDPGSGKSTFLRHLAHAAAEKRLRDGSAPFPVLVPVGDLAQFLGAPKLAELDQPLASEAPAWLPLFLTQQSRDNGVALPPRFFQDVLSQGPALLLVDGLDEAPTTESRSRVSRLLERVATAWPKACFAVTTRLQAFKGEEMLPGFHHAEIAPLDREAIAEFLRLWSSALFRDDLARAEKHGRRLLDQIESRPDIRRIASNPVMLTALAVLEWNERRMPDHRAELYKSVIEWLAAQRRTLPGRPGANACIGHLQELAGAMQCGAGGRRVQIGMDEAAEAMQGRLTDSAAAREFLEREQVDSGIVVNRGGSLRFWHLTFQEFLAARWMAGMEDARRHEMLFRRGLAWQPEWRETVLLLAGLLADEQGARLDGLVSAALDDLYGSTWVRRWLGITPGLREQARVAELLGSIRADLSYRKFEPRDPRCAELIRGVLGIFDVEAAKGIGVRERLAIAESLGKAGDPRLRLPSHHDYWVAIPGAGFQIGKYPVTVFEYGKFVEAGGEAPPDWSEQSQHPNRPVVSVDWNQAKAYCDAMSSGRITVKLPAAAQWERAARGVECREYAWGDEEPDPDRANYGKHLGHPTPVGMFPRGNTPEGVCDMTGNVWEWCEDWSDSSHQYKNCRGGAWVDAEAFLEASLPRRRHPAGRFDDKGFRCFRE